MKNIMLYTEYKALNWYDKQAIKEKIQNAYDPKNAEISIAALQTEYGIELVDRLVCEQLCAHCSEFGVGVNSQDELECETCAQRECIEVEIPSVYSDSDAIRSFGERLAGMSDADVEYFERKFFE